MTTDAKLLEKLKEIGDSLVKKKNHPMVIGRRYGKVGLVIFLLAYYKYSKDAKYEVTAKKLFEEIIEQISAGKVDGIIAEHLADVGTFLEYAKIHFPNFITESDVFLNGLDEVLIDFMNLTLANRDFDPVTGALISGNYFLARARSKKKVRYHLSELLKILNAISFKDENSFVFWKSVIFNDDRIYLGISHGSAAIIMFIIRIYKLDIERKLCKKILLRASKYIIANKVNDLGVFPSIVGQSNFESSLGWAYGDLGVAWALFNAGKILYEEQIVEEALLVFRSRAMDKEANEVYFKDGSICYGLSGAIYFFHEIYKNTGEEIFKEARDRWLEELLNKRDEGADDTAGYQAYYQVGRFPGEDSGFFTGISGIGLTLLNLLNDESCLYDTFLN